jgi:hypothetical protein
MRKTTKNDKHQSINNLQKFIFNKIKMVKEPFEAKKNPRLKAEDYNYLEKS